MGRILTILILILPLFVFAQTKVAFKHPPRNFSLNYITGDVVVHTKAVVAVKNAKPTGYSFEFASQRKDSIGFNRFRSFPRTGISIIWYDLGSPILGKALIGTYFFEPTYRLGKHLQLQFRTDIGLGYFSNPFDSINNFRNKNYSLPINPFMRVSAGVNIPLTKKITFTVNGHFSHSSNGNFKEPNAGLNWQGFLLGLRYYPSGHLLPKYQKPVTRSKLPKPSLDAGFMFTPKQGYHFSWQTTRKYLGGIFLHACIPVTRVNALSGTAELYHSKFEDSPGTTIHMRDFSTQAGISAGNEFLLGKIRFSQQIGFSLTKHPVFFNDIYHRWGLRYLVNKDLSIGFNLKVHEDVADFVDFRIQYRIF